MSGALVLVLAVAALAAAVMSVDSLWQRRRRKSQPVPPLRRDPDYDPKRYIPKPGGSGGNATYTPMYAFGACDLCHSPLAPGRAWRCGSGSTTTIMHAGTLDPELEKVLNAGGSGGSWPPPEPGESHQFCSQDHMHLWMDREGWER